jgi:hypothetical protein
MYNGVTCDSYVCGGRVTVATCSDQQSNNFYMAILSCTPQWNASKVNCGQICVGSTFNQQANNIHVAAEKLLRTMVYNLDMLCLGQCLHVLQATVAWVPHA